MEANGLNAEQVIQVRGFADRQLRKVSQPEDPSNRRVSVIVQYLPGQTKDPSKSPSLGQHAKSEEK